MKRWMELTSLSCYAYRLSACTNLHSQPEEYILQFQLTPERLRLAGKDALVLHPGPMIRGLEIDPGVADGPQSCVLDQVTNGLAIRMALLYHLVGGAASEPASGPGMAGKDK